MYFVDKHVRTKDILVENVLHERELIKKLHITVPYFVHLQSRSLFCRLRMRRWGVNDTAHEYTAVVRDLELGN